MCVADDILAEFPKKRTDRQILRGIRIFLAACGALAALVMIGGGLVEWDHASQPREFGVVTSLLPGYKGCNGRSVVTFDTPSRKAIQATLCTRSELVLGSAFEVRYPTDHPDQAVAADEDQAALLVIAPMPFIGFGLALLLLTWRRPDFFLSRRRYRG